MTERNHVIVVHAWRQAGEGHLAERCRNQPASSRKKLIRGTLCLGAWRLYLVVDRPFSEEKR